MKKHIIYFVLLILLFVSGCSSQMKVKLQDGTQARDENSNRSYEEWETNTEYISYHIEKIDGMSESDAKELIIKIEKDLKDVNHSLSGKTNAINLYIISRDLVKGGKIKHTYSIDQNIYTDVDKIESGEYLASVIDKTKSIPQLWIAYGLAAEIRERTIDPAELREVYSDSQNMNILRLSDVRFIDTVDEDNLSTAIQTAESLWLYIANNEKDKREKILSDDKSIKIEKLKEDWLKSIGATGSYHNPYGEGLRDFHGFYSKDCDLLVESSQITYNINMHKGYPYSYLTSADKVERLLYNNKMGIEEVKDYLKQFTDSTELYLDRHITYQMLDYNLNGTGYADPQTGIVTLCDPCLDYSHIHEAVHIFTLNARVENLIKDERRYLVEGIAEYVSDIVSKEYSKCQLIESDSGMVEYYNDYEWCKESEKIQEKNNRRVKVVNYYLEHGGTLDFPEHFDEGIFSDAFSKVYYDDLNNQAITDESMKDEIINSYSYLFMESWMKYVVNTYSMDTMLSILNDFNYEEKLGMSFEQTVKEWRMYLNRLEKF